MARARSHAAKATDDRAAHYGKAINYFRQAAKAAEKLGIFEISPIVANWGDLAFRNADWSEAADAFNYGTRGMLRAADANQTRESKEIVLIKFHDFASRGAYALAKLDRLDDAVAILESGRAYFVSRSISERAGISTATLTRVDIAEVAREAPLLYVAETVVGGLALLVKGDDTKALWLDDLRSDAVRAQVQRYRAAYTTEAWPATLDAVLQWLWTAGVGEIALVLGDTRRCYFVLCGMLGHLPVHAAWYIPSGSSKRQYLCDVTEIVYLPSATVLGSGKQGTSGGRNLVVREPLPVNARPLPGAGIEAAAVMRVLPTVDEIAEERATRAELLRALDVPRKIVHFAGHARAIPSAPMSSHLLMARNEQLSVADLVSLQRLAIGMLVLSACETAFIGDMIPDEAIGLATAFLQLGVKQVVASHWRVNDAATAVLMMALYRELASGSDVPSALARARQSVRTAEYEEIIEACRDASSDMVVDAMRSVEPAWSARLPLEHPVFWAGFSLFGAI